MASTIVTGIILLILSEITYFKQLVVMSFIFGKALLSLLFYTYNPYIFTTFSKFLSLLFPYFSVDGHLKACNLKLEDLTAMKRSPDLLNNVKIGQDQLLLIMKHILFYGGCGHFGQVT